MSNTKENTDTAKKEGASTPYAPSFMKSLFGGEIPSSYLHKFPFFNTEREADFQLMRTATEEWLKETVDSEKFEDNKGLPKEIIEGAKTMGLFGLIIPEAFGGSELNQTFYTRMLELCNQFDASVTLTIGAHQSIGLKALYLYGNDEQKKKYMPKLATGEMIAAFALTEPTAGSDAQGIKTRVVKEGDTYVLNGTKLWITNGGFADFFTVFAKENINGEDKITALCVTRDMGGVTHGAEEQKMGIKASSTVEVNFKNTRVHESNVIGKPGDGFKIAMGILNQGRLGLSGGALGVAKTALKQSIEYSKSRKAFGQSICEFGMVQNMITSMCELCYVLESMTYLTTHMVDEKNRDYSIEAAICKVYGTEAAWQVLNLAMQLHGGNGYMKDYGLERKLRDARIGLIFEGTNEILRMFISLTGLKEQASLFKKVSKELQNLSKIPSGDNATKIINDKLSQIGVLYDFAVSQMKQSIAGDEPEGFHPALEREVQRFGAAVKILNSCTGKLIRTYGHKLPDEQLQLERLANIAIDTYAIAAVLCRAHAMITKQGGVEKNQQELSLAQLAIRNAKARINAVQYSLGRNRDTEVKNLAKFALTQDHYPFDVSRVK